MTPLVQEAVVETPLVQEAEVEVMPMTYSLEKSSFGLLLEPEGRSNTLLTSIALASVILAGTFLIVMETGRSAKAPATVQTTASSAATNPSPAVKQAADLKTVDLEAKPTQVPVATASSTPAPAVTAPVKTVAATPAKSQSTAPTQTAHSSVAPTAEKKPTPPTLTAMSTKPANVTSAKPAARAAKPVEVASGKHGAKSSKAVVAAKPQTNSEPGLMTIMPDPSGAAEHHASASVPVVPPPATTALAASTALPATTAAVKSVRLQTQRAKKQVGSTGIGERIRPVSGAAKTKGSIETVGIPATAGTGLVSARGAVGSAGIPSGTVAVPPAEGAKKVASAGIPGQTRLTIASKRPVAPAPANLEMLSRRSTATNKQDN